MHDFARPKVGDSLPAFAARWEADGFHVFPGDKIQDALDEAARNPTNKTVKVPPDVAKKLVGGSWWGSPAETVTPICAIRWARRRMPARPAATTRAAWSCRGYLLCRWHRRAGGAGR